MTLHKLNVTMVFEGKEYQLKVSVEAPKTQANLILNYIYHVLMKRGLIKND